jgi:hypothetical protein
MQLKSRKTRPKKGAEAPDANTIWLTPRQLCKRWNVTDFTLRRWREQGKLKATAFSTRTIRFSIFEIERFEKFEMSTKPKFGLVQTRPLDELRPAPQNAHIYDAIASNTSEIRDRARSMKEFGVLEPIVISLDDVIMSGHRRYVAARLAGLKKVPVRVHPIKSDHPNFLKILVEFNAQRIKSAETLMREAAVKIDPKKARERLANEREMKIFESIWGRDLQTIESDDDGRRPILSDAKTPLLNAIVRRFGNSFH